ncbi:ABC transporter substrate-binding protein [Halocella sp. SP3-1]|uniref:ABC transporter substrate-binding protein n=1 Tax=Halocella sp. SP3-1 TaxID=2382161 RepID=UPI000F75B3E1|nr:ABC transporter substrate-binding protein [Halocella sp. SP3-1]AZO93282.1 ABC transporter substrate-binding protein [Halocella sp. SP3-1]
MFKKIICISLIITGLFTARGITADNKLVIYTALQEREAQVYAQAFENYTGIKVKTIRKSTGVLLNLLRRGKNYRPGVDVLLGGPAEFYYLANKEGLFEQYNSSLTKKIPQEYRDLENHWWGIYLGSIGFAVNPVALQKLNLKPPMTWLDLASPEYKGLITIPNPVSSGTGYTILSTIIQLYGLDEGIQLLKKINSNVQNYTNSGAMASKLTGINASTIGISFSHDIQKFKQQGYPINLILPTDGTGYEIGGIAIVKDTKHLKQAKQFVDFMLSTRGQKLYSAMSEYRLPTNIEAPIPDGAISFDNINVINYNLEWSSLQQENIANLWLNEVYLRGKTNENN